MRLCVMSCQTADSFARRLAQECKLEYEKGSSKDKVGTGDMSGRKLMEPIFTRNACVQYNFSHL